MEKGCQMEGMSSWWPLLAIWNKRQWQNVCWKWGRVNEVRKSYSERLACGPGCESRPASMSSPRERGLTSLGLGCSLGKGMCRSYLAHLWDTLNKSNLPERGTEPGPDGSRLCGAWNFYNFWEHSFRTRIQNKSEHVLRMRKEITHVYKRPNVIDSRKITLFLLINWLACLYNTFPLSFGCTVLIPSSCDNDFLIWFLWRGWKVIQSLL